jgi:lipoyl(octanoyl) transferase
MPYVEAYGWMHELAEARLRGDVPDTLLVVEHPPVYTAGRMWRDEHVLRSEAALRASGAEFHLVDRGGSVTFHGPGQLVGYAVVDLGLQRDVLGHLRRLEEVVIRACEDVGVTASRDPAGTGVWAEGRKVCAIGVRVKRARVTLHGFGLNCSTDLSWFDAIVPCGIHGGSVTSLSQLLGRSVGVEDLIEPVVRGFGEVFGLDVRETRLVGASV